MQQLKLGALFKAYAALEGLPHFLDQEEGRNLTSESLQQLTEMVSGLCDLLAEADMPVSLSSGRELAGLVAANPNAPSAIWRAPLDEFLHVVRHEMHTVTAWQVPREKLRFFEAEPFGLDVHARFPSANDDIEEAGKCIGMGRNTAGVFHLMRVMETGLRALGASLNHPALDPKRNPSWDAILKKCDEELRKDRKERSPEWAGDESFFSTATANLRAVKGAWRNPTMHVERRYNDEEAREVWSAVGGFMRQLATKLSESSPTGAVQAAPSPAP